MTSGAQRLPSMCGSTVVTFKATTRADEAKPTSVRVGPGGTCLTVPVSGGWLTRGGATPAWCGPATPGSARSASPGRRPARCTALDPSNSHRTSVAASRSRSSRSGPRAASASATTRAPAEHTASRFALTEFVNPAGFASPLHVHHDEHEAFYILEGRAQVHCGDEVFNVAPGSFVLLPRGIPHWHQVSSDAPLRSLVMTNDRAIRAVRRRLRRACPALS